MRSVRLFMPSLTAGRANFHIRSRSRKKEMPPQMISFVSGRIGLGASWQSSAEPPSMRISMQWPSTSVPPFCSEMSSASWVISSICSWVNSSSSPPSSCAEACGAKARSPTASRPLASIARVRNRTVSLLSPR